MAAAQRLSAGGARRLATHGLAGSKGTRGAARFLSALTSRYFHSSTEHQGVKHS